MANWVTTIYKIDGDKEQVQKVYEKNKRNDVDGQAVGGV